MSRYGLLLFVGVLCGFAPAPFPRERREKSNELSLASCQGTWEVVRLESVTGNEKRVSNWSVTHIRIRNDTWTLLYSDGQEVANYTLDVGAGRVATIDWFPLNNKSATPLWGGLVDRRGDTVRIMYLSGDRRGDKRQRDIDSAPANSYVITVRKGR